VVATVALTIVTLSLCWVTYTYCLYPYGVRLMARWFGRPVVQGDACPSVVMIISAFNEAQVIERKLVNALELDYPQDRIKIWVSSDGSDDGTNEIVRRLARTCPRIHLVAYSVNRGKTAALMATVRAVPSSVDVVVFSDANSMYRPDALRKLVRNFADPEVGCVAGELAYQDPSGEALYRRYENRIKLAQSRLGAPLTAEGSIFAVRRALVPEVEDTLIEDMVIPLRVAAGGYRVVYEPEAVSIEAFRLDAQAQWQRRARIVNRAVRSLRAVPEAWNPLRGGPGVVHFVSHRVMRWLAAFFLLAGYVASLPLLWQSWPMRLVGLLGVIALLWVAAGWAALRAGTRAPWLTLPFTFCVANLAAAAGVLTALAGVKRIRWTPVRQEPA
jgi:cellulose synthase/poly-beta-1,6-N-acetylglucosamine synthase-like glycosyltransferase